MFSISTMASSTSTPTTSDNASSVTTLRLKPDSCIRKKVGITASGKAVAATTVARALRRKKITTITASSAPSSSKSIEPRKVS